MRGDIKDSTILIIENDADTVFLLELLFETSGFTNVHATSDPRNVESLVRDLDPDLVLLDLHMPEVDGIEVMRRIEEEIPGHDIQMILMSGDVSPEKRRIGMEAGATHFVAKPYDLSTLVTKVEDALGHSKEAESSSE